MNPAVEEETFDFSQYRVNDVETESIPSQVTDNEESEPFDFNAYKVKEPPTLKQEIGRHVTRTGARIGETILGFPGDVVKFTKSLSEALPKPPSFLQKEPNLIQKAGKKALESVPGSEDLKKVSSYLTSGFTDPQGALEELGDEVTSLATILVEPAKAVESFPKFLGTIGKAFGKSAAVKGAGEGSKKLGATEGQQQAVELGTLFMTGLLGKKTADKFISEKYEKAKSLIPKGTLLDTTDMYFALEEAESKLSKGLSTPTKDKVRQSLDELKAKASGGLMEAEEVIQSVHDINEIMNSKKLFDELNTSERRLLKSRFDLVKDELHQEVAKYGKTNPEFYKEWTEANKGYGAIASSKKVGNWFESKIGKLPKHLVGSLAIDLFLGHPAAIPATIGSYSFLKTGELLTRIVKDPKLTEHYMKVLLEAGNENLPGAIKHLNALDKAAKTIQK
jgi:hypothetical protein